MTDEPWTFEDLEVHASPGFDVYDPNLARNVATFYDEDEALAYARWRNKKQAKARRRQRAEAESRQRAIHRIAGMLGGPL